MDYVRIAGRLLLPFRHSQFKESNNFSASFFLRDRARYMASESIQRVADAAENFVDGRLCEAAKSTALRVT